MTKNKSIWLFLVQLKVLIVPFLLVYIQIIAGMFGLPVLNGLLAFSLWWQYPIYSSWFYGGADRVLGVIFSSLFWILVVSLNTKYNSKRGLIAVMVTLASVIVVYCFVVHQIYSGLGYSLKWKDFYSIGFN